MSFVSISLIIAIGLFTDFLSLTPIDPWYVENQILVNSCFCLLVFTIFRSKTLDLSIAVKKANYLEFISISWLLILTVHLVGTLISGLNVSLGGSAVEIIPDIQTKVIRNNIFPWWGAILIAPVIEEILYRRVLIGSFSDKLNVAFLVLLSSFLFGVTHFPFKIIYLDSLDKWLGITPFFAAGLVFAIIYLRYGLKYSIIAHMINNSVVYYSKGGLVTFKHAYYITITLLTLFSILYVVYRLVSTIKLRINAK